jgi:hypothetical protein
MPTNAGVGAWMFTSDADLNERGKSHLKGLRAEVLTIAQQLLMLGAKLPPEEEKLLDDAKELLLKAADRLWGRMKTL